MRPLPGLPALVLATTLFTLVSTGLVGLGAPARAFGPGVHSREAQEVLRRLADADVEYAALAATPQATSWLSLGAISPDFMFMADALGFGHEPGLSKHLMEQAAALSPEYRLFALGHACHVASDGSSEAFVVPALFSSAAIGATDLFSDQPAYKEAEGVVESLGDLVTGDWDAIVDLLYDLWMPPVDRARFDDVFAWYCATGSAYLGRAVDCTAARAQVGGALARLEEVLASYDREGAHAFIDDLVGMPIEQLIDLALMAADGGSFGGLIGAGLGTGTTPWVRDEVAYLVTTAFVDRAFWGGYEALAGLGPSFALDRIADGTSGWPSYDAPGIESGLLASYLRYLPDEYAVTTGFMIDELTYRGPGGEVLDAVGPELAGQTLTATVRFYAAVPLVGTLRGRVRKDRPGLAAGSDPIVGEASVAIDVDPTAYARTPRGTLTIPFVVDLEGALGFSVELALGDAAPLITTSRDRLWSLGEVDLDGSAFREILGTFPRSLPVASPTAELTGLAVVEVVVAPDGPGLEGANVTLGGYGAATGPRGFAVYGDLTPGTHALKVKRLDYADHDGTLEVAAIKSAADADGVTRVKVGLHAYPYLVAGSGRWSTDRETLAVRVDPTPFAGQALGFAVSVSKAGRRVGEAELPRSGLGTVVFAEPLHDGARLAVKARAVYAEGFGIEAEVEVVVDASPPVIAPLITSGPTRDCLAGGAGPWRASTNLDIELAEPHSALDTLQWRAAGAWQSLDVREDDGLFAELVLPEGYLDADELELRAVNAAGLETVAAVALPPAVTLPACTEAPDGAESGPETDDPGDAGSELAEAEPTAPTSGSGSEGCHGGGSPLLALLLLAAIGLARKVSGSRRPARADMQ